MYLLLSGIECTLLSLPQASAVRPISSALNALPHSLGSVSAGIFGCHEYFLGIAIDGRDVRLV
jgi:hypothetical protein